jgi:hypothetical protein
MQIAMLIGGAVVVLNVAFFFLSDLYYDRPNPIATPIMRARATFAALTAILAAASFTASLAPRLIGHSLAAVLGAASIVAGIGAFSQGMPMVLGATLLIVGVLMPTLAYFSLHHSRAAWAFLIALVAVFGGVDFFGAPKVRGLLGVGLWTALILPGLQFVAVVSLTMLRGEYREKA